VGAAAAQGCGLGPGRIEGPIVYLDADEQNADWLKTGHLGWWTPDRIERCCGEPYATYLETVRSKHVDYYAARPNQRSRTHAFAAAAIEHALPPGHGSLTDRLPSELRHRQHLSGGSSQILAVSLLAPAADADSGLAWLGLGDVGRNVRSRFEVELDSSVLREHPRTTTIDWLVESDDAVVAVEAKFTEPGIGACSCKGFLNGDCSARILKRPYWEAAREELGLDGPVTGAPCRLGLAYQAVRNVAAARELAQGRRAGFVLLYDARNPYFARTGAWPGWPALLGSALKGGSVAFRALSWQELTGLRAVPKIVRDWADEKHGIAPATDGPPPNALFAFLKKLPGKRAQLDLAEELGTDPSPLVSAFRATVEAYREYDNLEPFHTAPTTFPERRPWPPRAAHDLADRFSREGGLELDGRRLRYIDREITAYAGDAKADALKADLFLADPQGRPILVEVKLRADKNAFHALVQLLATAAPLLGSLQRTRLALWGSSAEFVVKQAGKVDLLVLLVDPPQKALDDGLRTAAGTLASRLRSEPEIAQVIRRLDVAALESTAHGLEPLP
jgi:hypothetical protein